MKAPPSSASFGRISGVGFAKANIIGFLFIFFTHSFFNACPTDTPINTSAPLITYYKEPLIPSKFDILAKSYFSEFIPSFLPVYMAPFVSQIIIFFPWAPYLKMSRAIVSPAAPAPFITILTSLKVFPASFIAVIKPPNVTIAVPCWSSWKTGSFLRLLRPF